MSIRIKFYLIRVMSPSFLVKILYVFNSNYYYKDKKSCLDEDVNPVLQLYPLMYYLCITHINQVRWGGENNCRIQSPNDTGISLEEPTNDVFNQKLLWLRMGIDAFLKLLQGNYQI